VNRLRNQLDPQRRTDAGNGIEARLRVGASALYSASRVMPDALVKTLRLLRSQPI
jgi:hypothetical protein